MNDTGFVHCPSDCQGTNCVACLGIPTTVLRGEARHEVNVDCPHACSRPCAGCDADEADKVTGMEPGEEAP